MKTGRLSRANRIVVAVVLGLAALVALAKTYVVVSTHQASIVRAERETLNATGILAEHAARTFEGISRVLDAAAELRADVEAGAVAGAGAIHDALKTIQGGSPVILGIGWSDAAGNRIASAIYRDPPPLNIADQDQFRVHRDDPDVGLYISAPLRSRLDGTWIIPLSRRIEDGSGRFAGVVNAVLRVDYFLEFYRAIDLGPDTGVILARGDGVLLAQAPMVEDWMGRSLAGSLTFPIASPRPQPANLRATGPIDGKERIFGFASIPGFPLAVAAIMSDRDALAPFRETLFWSALEGVLTIAALMAGGAIIVIVLRRREAAARELEETGALLQSVFAVSNQAIIIFDRDLRAVAWNELYEKLYGDAPALSRGVTLESLLRAMAAGGEHGSGDAETFVADRLKMARSRQPARHERARPDGSVVDDSWLPLPNGYLAISYTDITRQKHAEIARRESEAKAVQAHVRLVEAVDSLADPFFLWDAEERLVLANTAATKGPGSEVLVPGARLEDVIVNRVKAGAFAAAIGREDDYIHERLAQIRRATGEPAEVQHTDGRWLATWDRRTREGGIVSLRVDITDLKRAEAALRESEARVALAHARLIDAVDSLDDPFFLWDAEERLVLANAAAAKGPGGEMLRPGMRLEDVLVHRVRAGRFPAASGHEDGFVSRRLAQIRAATGVSTELQLADGRWLSMRDRRTREGGAVSLFVDVTEMKTREAELAAARRAADTASRAKSDFLSRMSHELRTPLNAVIGFSQLMQIDRRDPLAPRQLDYCRDIESGGRHLLALVNDVLDLAQIESGNDRMSIERTGVADVLLGLGAAMAALARAAEVDLRIADPAGLPDLRADRLRLRQVLLNLVSNGIKYNRKGGSVSVSATVAPGDRVRLAVADIGIGISAERQAEVFEPFHRLGQEHSGIDGTGIGLAICKRLVEAMDGSIGFVSTAGEGSTFWIELPADVSASIAAVADKASGPGPAEMLDRAGRFSLLYVEDNPANMRLVEHLISILPHVELLTAATPLLGLALARAHRPDIILLDLHLPEMSGYEMLTHLKAMPETRDIPVLALTAAAMPSDIERGLAAGFFRYLTKPIDLREFLEAIGECIPLTDGDGDEDAELSPRDAAGPPPESA